MINSTTDPIHAASTSGVARNTVIRAKDLLAATLYFWLSGWPIRRAIRMASEAVYRA